MVNTLWTNELECLSIDRQYKCWQGEVVNLGWLRSNLETFYDLETV